MFSAWIRLLICLMITSGAHTFDDYDETDDYDYYDKDADEYGGDKDYYDSDTDPRLWHGHITSYENHPYFAQIVILLPSMGYRYGLECGGSFIARDMVLTAAHCFFEETTFKWIPARKFRVRYGTNLGRYTNGTEQEFGLGFHLKIHAVRIHPDFRPFGKNKFDYAWIRSADYALVFFKPPKVMNYRLLLLPEPYEDVPFMSYRNWTTIVGAGRSIPNYGNRTDYQLILKQNKVRIFSRCSWMDRGFNPAYRVCAYGDDGDYRVCGGDSGSPVYAETPRGKVVIAIVSDSLYPCTVSDKWKDAIDRGEIVYAAIGPALNWIYHIAVLESVCPCLGEATKKWLAWYWTMTKSFKPR